MLASDLRRSEPEVAARLNDAVLEEIEWFIDMMRMRHRETSGLDGLLLFLHFVRCYAYVSVFAKQPYHKIISFTS
jgi:hypothetical protein